MLCERETDRPTNRQTQAGRQMDRDRQADRDGQSQRDRGRQPNKKERKKSEWQNWQIRQGGKKRHRDDNEDLEEEDDNDDDGEEHWHPVVWSPLGPVWEDGVPWACRCQSKLSLWSCRQPQKSLEKSQATAPGEEKLQSTKNIYTPKYLNSSAYLSAWWVKMANNIFRIREQRKHTHHRYKKQNKQKTLRFNTDVFLSGKKELTNTNAQDWWTKEKTDQEKTACGNKGEVTKHGLDTGPESNRRCVWEYRKRSNM